MRFVPHLLSFALVVLLLCTFAKHGHADTRPAVFETMESLSQYEMYDWTQSTESNYKVQVVDDDDDRRQTDPVHYGRYAAIRKTLDYSYHAHYVQQRQLLQDSIIDSFLDNTIISDSTNGQSCTTPEHPWIVFTAGCMGAGKSWTIRHLSAQRYFPLQAFLAVDPDEIRRWLPEFPHYLEEQPLRAGEYTRKEAGFIAEVLTMAALQRGQNVLVDGSLRDVTWYSVYFQQLRQDFEKLRIGILHITAPKELIFQRASSRAQETGRVVPHEVLEEAMEQVPLSIHKLAPLVDFFAEIHNGFNDPEISTPLDWELFRSAWSQSCSKNDDDDQNMTRRSKDNASPPVCEKDESTIPMSKL